MPYHHLPQWHSSLTAISSPAGRPVPCFFATTGTTCLVIKGAGKWQLLVCFLATATCKVFKGDGKWRWPLSCFFATDTCPVGWVNFAKCGLGLRSFGFRANCYFFVEKWANKRFTQKNEWFTHFAHFWWTKWAIHSHCSFELSRMCNSLTSLNKKEEMSKNEWFTHFLEFFF